MGRWAFAASVFAAGEQLAGCDFHETDNEMICIVHIPIGTCATEFGTDKVEH